MRSIISSLFIIGLVGVQAGCVKRSADWPMAVHIPEQTEATFRAKSVFHVVAKDETLSEIAHQSGVKIQDLAGVNNLEEPYVIKEGSKLIVPKQSTEQAADKGQGDEPTAETKDLRDSKLSWPISGRIIKEFGAGDAVHRNGITIEGINGAKVKASEAGKVGHVGEIPGLGKVVLIDHSERLVSVYAHLNETAVSVGDDVARNQIIGSLSGASKRDKPTLYFEVRSHAKPTDPLKFFSPKP